MTNPLQLNIGIEAPHRNRYLFSDHYLENLLPADPRWEAGLSNIVGVYGDHHLAYQRLVERIAATNRLIDLIVYRLYGLTEEEVAIVEEPR